MAPYMSDSWRAWVAENTRRGVARLTIYDRLRTHGFGLGAIRAVMGATYPEFVETDSDGRDSSGRTTRYAELANCALTQRKAPGLRRILASKAQIYVWDDFLPPDTCSHIRELTTSGLQRSTITTEETSGTYDPTFRTSRTCHLERVEHPLIAKLDQRISEGLGISQKWAEPNQAQKYEVGQEFKAHTDYFEPGSDEFTQFCAELGQRTWTFMIYLNEGCEGGTTRFRKLDKSFQPKLGRAVIWNNLTAEGDPNPLTIHHGMKVREGEKFVITRWFRDKGRGPLLLHGAN